MLALCFETLPFVVRTVQPVDPRARRGDGGGRALARRRDQFTVFRPIVLPNTPARDPFRLRRSHSPSRARRDRLDRPHRGEPPSTPRSPRSSSSTLIQDGDVAPVPPRSRSFSLAAAFVLLLRRRRASLLHHEARTCVGGVPCAGWRSRYLLVMPARAARDGLLPHVPSTGLDAQSWQALVNQEHGARLPDHPDRGGDRGAAQHGLRRPSAGSRSCRRPLPRQRASLNAFIDPSPNRPCRRWWSASVSTSSTTTGWFGSRARSARRSGCSSRCWRSCSQRSSSRFRSSPAR